MLAHLVNEYSVTNGASKLEVAFEVLNGAGIVVLSIVENTQRAARFSLRRQFARGLRKLQEPAQVVQ